MQEYESLFTDGLTLELAVLVVPSGLRLCECEWGDFESSETEDTDF